MVIAISCPQAERGRREEDSKSEKERLLRREPFRFDSICLGTSLHARTQPQKLLSLLSAGGIKSLHAGTDKRTLGRTLRASGERAGL